MIGFQSGIGGAPRVRGAKTTHIRQQQEQRSREFAAVAAEKIRSVDACGFSGFDSQALAQKVSAWYESCTKAMLAGDYSLIDRWIGEEAQLAAESRFELEDLLQLLRTCRSVAVEVEQWNEDVFASVDEVINETLRNLPGRVPWAMPAKLDYRLPGALVAAAAPEMEVAEPDIVEPGIMEPEIKEPAGERRRIRRVQLRLPVRIRGAEAFRNAEELAYTRDVSRGGLCFVAREDYSSESVLNVAYPYWIDPGAINKEYAAKVVRLERLSDGCRAVAVKFLRTLGAATV